MCPSLSQLDSSLGASSSHSSRPSLMLGRGLWIDPCPCFGRGALSEWRMTSRHVCHSPWGGISIRKERPRSWSPPRWTRSRSLAESPRADSRARLSCPVPRGTARPSSSGVLHLEQVGEVGIRRDVKPHLDGLRRMVEQEHVLVDAISNGALADNGQLRVLVDRAGWRIEEELSREIIHVVGREDFEGPAFQGQG